MVIDLKDRDFISYVTNFCLFLLRSNLLSMAATPNKQEPVFELIRSMSKAEKRNFKLYATRLSGNQQAKFIALFDCLDGMEEYNEKRILQRCPIKKEQLPNMKAHLYKQILVSIRLLEVQHSLHMQLHEQLDFARILYNKGLYQQSSKLLDKAADLALQSEQYTVALDFIELQKKIDTQNTTRGMISKSEKLNRLADTLCDRITRISELANIATQLYGLYLQLGYARTQKDINLIIHVYGQRLSKYENLISIRPTLGTITSCTTCCCVTKMCATGSPFSTSIHK